MQTPSISAALPPASSSAARNQQTDGQGQAHESSFSAVLTGQQTTRQAAAKTSASGTPAAGTPNTAGTTGKPGDKKAPAADKAAPDEPAAATQAAAQAQAAAEQGLGLPQIALDIASQAAAAAQHPVTARGAAPTLTDAQAKVLPGALTDAPAKTETPLPAQTLLDAVDKTAASLPLAATAALPTKGTDTAITAKASVAGLAAPLPASPALATGNKAMALTGAQQAKLAAQSQKPEPASGKAASSPAAAAAAAVGVSAGSDTAATRLADTAAFAPDATQPANTPANGSFAATMQAVQVMNNPAPHALPFTTAQPAVATPLQSPQWSTDFSRQFISLTQGGHNMPHTAELRLDPPELGPLRITINISDNVAHAIFASPHAAVRQTVENALPQLQQMLAQAGISLGQTTVNDQAQQEQAYNETFGGSRKGSSDANAAGTGTDGAVMANQTAARQIAPNALVDTFA